jgi:2-phosphoglycerate kinase
MDGVSLVPGLLDLEAYASSAEPVMVLIATRDEEVLRSRFHARAREQARRAPERYVDHLDGILEIQRHLIEVAEQSDVPIVDNTSFDHSVQEIVAQVMSRLQTSEARRRAS